MNRTVDIFSLSINDNSVKNVLEKLSTESGFRFVVTPNVQHFIGVNENQDLLSCYKKACLTLCDSRVVQLIAGLLNKPIRNVITGSDLTKYLFEGFFNGKESIMIIGSSTKDIDYLRERYNLANLDHYIPPMGFIEDNHEIGLTIKHILKVKPKYLFLAVGFPRQEILSCRLQLVADFDCTAFCIGASIDFLTGKQSRAPLVWQKMRLEWMYRFLCEPKRLFRRYFVEGWKLFYLIIQEISPKN